MASFSDTHCHLNLNHFINDLDEVIASARARGVVKILVPGIDLESSLEAIRISEKYQEVFAAVGVHPNSAQTWNPDTLKNLTQLAIHPKVVAIGEIGLDFYRDSAPPDIQQEVFEEQLGLAKNLSLPVIIHERQSQPALWKTLMNWHAGLVSEGNLLRLNPGILHAFDGDEVWASQAIQHNFKLGIGGPITYPNAKSRRQILLGLPLESLVIETDAPYLTPQQFRGKRNEPAYVTFVAERIADLHSIEIESVAKITSDNAIQLFNWGAVR